MGYVLGIDIGTGSAKAIAVNIDSEPVAVSQHHYPTYSPMPGYSEQDPELIWDAFINCLKEILDELKEEPDAICFSSAMHSLMPVDTKGQKLLDLITWADSRGDAIATRLKSSTQGKEIYESSGMPVHAMSPLCKIIWLKENMPAIFHKTHKFISIKEYIWFKLFGEYTIDHSIACATGMFDISSLKWNLPLLELAGISEDQLSKPVSTTYTVKKVAASEGISSGLLKNTAYVIGASDGCLANLGSFAIGKGVAAVTIGTSGAVRIASSRPIFNYEAMTFSYCLDEKIFICGGPINNGGNILLWLIKDFLGKSADKQNFEQIFATVEQVSPGSEGLFFLPYLNGERAPIWDGKSSGAFAGIRSVHNQSHFCRAVLEGICYALYDVLQVVERSSERIDQINVSGGFVQSTTWMQLLSDICGKRLALLHTEDASALGAAFLAMKALGLNEGKYPEIPKKSIQNYIEPDMTKHQIYKRNFAVFKSLYSGLKDSMHEIHLINS